MMDSLISIIIPVYNVEEYLRECLESVLVQTYQNLEIILVDDGSTDNSGSICDEYKKKDSRVKVIHKKNGGLSDARNAGLDICSGEYIGFVDSDDWISKEMYEHLYREAYTLKADMVVSGYYVVSQKGVTVVNKSGGNRYIFEDYEKMMGYIINNVGCMPVCFKLYRSTIFDNVRFKKGKNFEDVFIFPETVANCKRMVIVPGNYYYYRMRNDSITHKKKWNGNIWDAIEAYKYNYTVVKNNCPKLIDGIEKRLFWSYCVCLSYAGNAVDYDVHNGEINKKKSELKKHTLKIIKNPMMSWKNKIDALMAMYLPVKIYSYMSNMFRK